MNPIMVVVRKEYPEKGEEPFEPDPRLLVGVISNSQPYGDPEAVLVDRFGWFEALPLRRVAIYGHPSHWPIDFRPQVHGRPL